MNWYAYVGNDPAAYVDPEGRIPIPAIVGGIAGFGGGMIGARIQCATWPEAFAAGVVGGAIGFGTGLLGPAGGAAVRVLAGTAAGGIGGGVGDFIGQGIGYAQRRSPGGFRPDWGSVAGAAGFGALGGGISAGISAAAVSVSAGTATFGVWGEVATEIGANVISFGFTAFGGIYGHEFGMNH